ncbi:MAG: nickel-dependent lactate racemase [Terriglobales bacterium]
MDLTFPYPGIGPVSVPDANLLGVFAPRHPPLPAEPELVERALARPIEAPRLRELARRGHRVLLLSDDNTRGTPIARILPWVTAELETAGVRAEDIEILICKGSHRPMTEPELEDKLGAYRRRFRVYQHDYLNASELHDWGPLPDGFPVIANRLLRQRGLVIGLGHIGIHRIKGFSGGAKIVFPGCAGYASAAANHWAGAQRWSEQLMGVRDNPLRERIDQAARRVGLNYLVNVVLAGGAIAGCFAGDPVAAHRAGCALAAEIYGVDLPRRADIVIVESKPADRDFWQSAKGIYSGTMAVKRNGSLILVTSSPEGVANNHPIVMQLGYLPYSQLERMVAGHQIQDVMGAAVLAYTAQVMDHADCILVSTGISAHEARQLGFRPAQTVQDALEMAFLRQGKDAAIAVLREGGSILPRVAGEQLGRRPKAA